MELDRRNFLKLSVTAGAAGALSGAISVFDNDANAAPSKEGFEPLPNINVGGIIRPPGALPEKEFRAKCISCGVCVNVCHTMKYDTLSIAGLSDLKNFGLPYVKDTRDFPCALCMECPKSCPTGALQPVKKQDVKMGVALIDLSICFGWNGDVCLSCSKACPMGATIFDFYNGEWGNQPMINDKCVGCGLCVKYCPLGGSAIKVITRDEYKKVKDEYLLDFKKTLAMTNEERYNLVYGVNLPLIMSRGRLIEREYRD